MSLEYATHYYREVETGIVHATMTGPGDPVFELPPGTVAATQEEHGAYLFEQAQQQLNPSPEYEAAVLAYRNQWVDKAAVILQITGPRAEALYELLNEANVDPVSF